MSDYGAQLEQMTAWAANLPADRSPVAQAAEVSAMTMAEYLALPAVSSGLLNTLLTKSPLHAWYDSPFNPRRTDKPSKEADVGTLAHACLLEGGTDNVRVFDPSQFPNAKGGGVATGWSNKAIRTARDEARANGEIPMLLENFAAVQAMVAEALRFVAESEIAGVFGTGAAEQTIVFDQLGFLCKARPDWLTADMSICLSYKTTAGSGNPDAWIRTQLPSYDLATVFYESAVLSIADPDAAVRVVHLVQEQAAPWACSLVALGPASADLACRKLDMALRIWRDCAAAGKWTAYPTRICYAEPKPWQVAEVEERDMNAAYDALQEKEGIQA